MKTFELNGKVREDLGKKATKAVRSEEAVPCVLYGGEKNTHFTATNSDLRKLVYSPEVYLVELNIDGKKSEAIMKDLQFHPVTDKILHIDFLQVNDKKPVVVEIPVKLSGLAEGVKAGGKMSLEMRKLKVRGIYTQIPESITLDVTSLGLGKSIQVGSVSVDKLEILNAKNAVVAQVKLTRAARGAAAAAAAAKK
ncbi:50S ribosomal protein L25/general stress protein Ctc [Paludibacter sp. 221]|uniref:50S ribosomal protein L25/general stress protein Ctc n=1 Tax=Paludibacter sp. 221 TaxID=2302939 RepID=UPI0013CFDA58|nr:50S ribosomal protein L25/general stress protein Ctc [Paludibacter sp. 221]NDV45761.1 50S ribosomal protein L25/general stress protein Ctc [Paludibacter sp. 221]